MQNYKHRLCADIAFAPLPLAKEALGGHAICAQVDVTQIPFADDSVDSILCAHVLYHVPADEQAKAILELYRILKPGGRLIIIYTWPRSFMDRLGIHLNPRVILPKIPGMRWIWRTFFRKRILGTEETENTQNQDDAAPKHPPLYFSPHPYSWFKHTFKDAPFTLKFRCCQAVGLPFSNAFVPNHKTGKLLLRFIALLEDCFPHIMARLGTYPFIIIDK